MADEFREVLPGANLAERVTTDEDGRVIKYYVSRPKNPAPILLMIQGSGCQAIFNFDAERPYSTLFNLVPFAAEGSFTVVAVEKPFASMKAQGGSAEECGDEFNQYFTAENWLKALKAALKHARRLPWVARERTFVMGGSEGAVMASLLAGDRSQRITDVAMIGVSGTTQLFDRVAHAYLFCFDRASCIQETWVTVQKINEDPDRADLFAWGHPYKRWTSFFKVDPGNELVKSRAKIYVALGTEDQSVPALSQEIAIAKVMANGREVYVRRIDGGDHNLRVTGAKAAWSGLDAELRHAIDWFWKRDDGNRPKGIKD